MSVVNEVDQRIEIKDLFDAIHVLAKSFRLDDDNYAPTVSNRLGEISSAVFDSGEQIAISLDKVANALESLASAADRIAASLEN